MLRTRGADVYNANKGTVSKDKAGEKEDMYQVSGLQVGYGTSSR